MDKLIANLATISSIELPVPKTFLRAGGIAEIREVVPARPGIYAIFYKNGVTCFYVGSSASSIRTRLLIHYGANAKDNYRGKLGKLRATDKFRFWFHVIEKPTRISDFRSFVAGIEALCSAAWNPEVRSYKY